MTSYDNWDLPIQCNDCWSRATYKRVDPGNNEVYSLYYDCYESWVMKSIESEEE